MRRQRRVRSDLARELVVYKQSESQHLRRAVLLRLNKFICVTRIMSLVPLLLSDLLEEPHRPLFDQNFGLGLIGDDLVNPLLGPLRTGYYRPWRHLANRNSGVSNVVNTKDNFQIHLDVQQFKPNEINVKVVDNFLQVEGKHEERKDEHGFISREFTRRYALPKDVEPETVTSTLSSDGVLTITAPKKALPAPKNERAVPITQTNAPAIKDTEKSKSGQEKMEQ